MNFSQKIGLFVLILITVAYVYFSFFHDKLGEFEDVKFPNQTLDRENFQNKSNEKRTVKIFLLNNSGDLKALTRVCDLEKEESCFRYAILELLLAPTKSEKAKGFTSEIPAGTKILSLRESSNSIMIDLSNNFEAGGGAESTYMRIRQIIKTANANTSLPVYLYINGKQANVIGGEGIMIKQPLSERSFDE